MKTRLFLSLSLAFVAQLCVAQNYLISAQSLGTDAASTFQPFISQAKYNVHSYKVTYHTTDIDGTPTIASGAVVLPQAASCDTFTIISYAHGTVLEKEDVPSRNNQEATIAKIGASIGAVAVAPDYLGLGDNPGLHPYLHAESEATATIDLIRAAREFLDSLNMGYNGEVFFTGYSQGGHAAMAAAKYVQDNNLFNEFNVIGAGPASGPYNLSGTQADVLISDEPYSNPGYVFYLFLGMQRVYGNVFNSYDEIFKAPYDTLIPPYFDGTYDMGTVNFLLPDTLSGFVQDSVLTNFKNDSIGKTHPIWQFLTANDNYDWAPQFPVEMYYCTKDEQVDYHNALVAEDSMNARGAASAIAIDKGAYTHGTCIVQALPAAVSFFLSKKSGCNIGVEEFDIVNIDLYPNPAENYFTVEGLQDPVQAEVISSAGTVCKRLTIQPNERTDISDLPTGVYVLKLDLTDYSVTQRLIKQ